MKQFVQMTAVLIISLGFLSTCQTKPVKDKPHHTKSGFRNVNPNFENKNLINVIWWQIERLSLRNSLDPKDYPEFPTLHNDGKTLRSNQKSLSVTWVGHASTLIQLDNVNILTDPIWSERCSPVSFAGPKRFTKPGLSLDDLPPIDIVILSHNHYDHTDLPTLKELERRFHPRFFIGLGNQTWLQKEGLGSVSEMDWWDKIEVKGIRLHFTPSQHFSGRGLFDRDETLWGSYVLEGKSQKVYFGGDTGYYSHFREIGERFGSFDVAILPIGAFEPRWFMAPVHVDPAETVQAFVDLRAKYLIPIHYMTFVLSDEALDSPVPLAKEAMAKLKKSEDALVPLKIGETRFF
ncbi:MBL fold metallo-hydrolase [Leptospira sp. 96542]|nr:MBL fold metallo-hydrolase [Leptospira sp. 96542]